MGELTQSHPFAKDFWFMFDVGVLKASVVRDTITSVMSFIFAGPLGGFVWGFVWMRENRGLTLKKGGVRFIELE